MEIPVFAFNEPGCPKPEFFSMALRIANEFGCEGLKLRIGVSQFGRYHGEHGAAAAATAQSQ
jgi:hypothetical protein